MRRREIALGDAFRVKHGFAFKSEYFSDAGEFVVLTPGNFNEKGGFRLRPGKDRYYKGDIPEEFVLDEGALIVAMTEQGPGLLGSSALVPHGARFLHNQRLGLIQDLDESILDKRFLYYLFNTRSVRAQISASASGTKVRHTAPERIYRVTASIPQDVAVQKKVSSILQAYDALIENNRRRIQLLEQAARLLYKEWFVHLRFPGHEHVKTTGGVPEGWELKKLADVTTKIGSGATPRGGAAAYQTEGITLIRSLNVYDFQFADDGLAYIDKSQADKLANVIVEPLDILLNITGASVGRCCMVPSRHLPARVNQHVMLIRVHSQRCGPHYAIHTINSHQQKERLLSIARAGGSTREALTKDVVSNIAFAIPPRHLLDEFERVASGLFCQQENLSAQNAQLAKARDLLLPRLMNGQIPV